MGGVAMRIKGAFFLFMLVLINGNDFAQNRTSTDGSGRMHHLMPVPASVRFHSGRLSIDDTFKAAVKGHTDARLQAGLARALQRLGNRTGLDFAREVGSDTAAATLVVQCQGPGQEIPSPGEDESYTLEVSSKQAVLSAPTAVGALRGLETFLQLIEGDARGYFLPPASLQDRPRFPWRGLLIDVCRHWQPMEVLKRNLDGMAAVKLNVLHWHISEDQGFRVESRRYPKLHQMGSDGLYYTQEQVREIVAYARERGIRVVPEFDMPGHATSWLVGHPELASAPGPYRIERKFGIFDPTLDPTREEVYTLLDGFLGEMAALFPDTYMHIGGDENNGKQWKANPKIQAFMQSKGLKDNHALQAYFNKRLSVILKKHGKKMVGWDEILHPDLPNDIVVQSWRGQASLAEAARKGYTGLLSFGYYLDHMLPTAGHYAVDPMPMDSGLDARQAERILGGEACMWAEYVSPETIDSRIWPRMAAIAERLWSPREVTDVKDMYRRLERVSLWLEELGLTHEKFQTTMLRRLAGRGDIAPLKTLVDVVEPVKVYRRGRLQPSTQMTPLTRLVDAARPDSTAGRRFAAVVDGLLSDAPNFRTERERAVQILSEWWNLRPAIDEVIAASPILRQAEPLAKELSELGAAGLEAINSLISDNEPAAIWRSEKLALLNRAAAPKAAVEFAILTPMRQLITAAAEKSQLRTLTPAEWKKRVLELSTEKKGPGK